VISQGVQENKALFHPDMYIFAFMYNQDRILALYQVCKIIGSQHCNSSQLGLVQNDHVEREEFQYQFKSDQETVTFIFPVVGKVT
jgi:hypothetical protein